MGSRAQLSGAGEQLVVLDSRFALKVWDKRDEHPHSQPRWEARCPRTRGCPGLTGLGTGMQPPAHTMAHCHPSRQHPKSCALGQGWISKAPSHGMMQASRTLPRHRHLQRHQLRELQGEDRMGHVPAHSGARLGPAPPRDHAAAGGSPAAPTQGTPVHLKPSQCWFGGCKAPSLLHSSGVAQPREVRLIIAETETKPCQRAASHGRRPCTWG